MSEKQSLHLHCPHCQHANSVGRDFLPSRVREFQTITFACHKCKRWLRLDLLIGPSLLGLSDESDDDDTEPSKRPIGLHLP